MHPENGLDFAFSSLRYWGMINTTQSFTCEPVQWITEGTSIARDEEHAFRYEVRDVRGDTVGFITADRARQHPGMMWKRSLFRDGKIEELDGAYSTVDEALAAF